MRNKKIGFAILTFLPLFAATVESRACIGHFLAAALIVHGGQLASDVVTDGGLRNYVAILGSGSLVFVGIIVTLILYGVGLALAWPSSRHRATGPRT